MSSASNHQLSPVPHGVTPDPDRTSTLRVSPLLLRAIEGHAVTAYPDECCGALIGRNGIVLKTFALPNTTSEAQRRRFLIGPDDYRRAETRAAALGADLIGFYHSHPDHPAQPSPYDLEHAWPQLIYLIVSVEAGRPGQVAAWRLAEDRSRFDEVELFVEGDPSNDELRMTNDQ